jgi:hypothetical protein
MRAAAAVFLGLLALAHPAAAGTGLLVGVDDDNAKWTARNGAYFAVYRDLGLKALRITVDWHAGETGPTRTDLTELGRVIPAAFGLRVVLAVSGGPADAPLDESSRDRFCGFAASLLQRFPTVNDVVVWTEPNSTTFWRPKQGAPGAYEALLARCWDVLHAVRPRANLIAASAPHQKPAAWYAGLGAALRASGRRLPILDTVGHNAYPNRSDEAPDKVHKGASLDEGDYARLLDALRAAFAGTPQPLPGEGGVTVWYMEDGFQTAVDPSRSFGYHGVETDRHLSTDQGAQLAAAVRLAYCQPAVGAFFNFQLADERDLGGWQSGVLWADGTPKPSYGDFRQAVRDVSLGAVACPGPVFAVK